MSSGTSSALKPLQNGLWKRGVTWTKTFQPHNHDETHHEESIYRNINDASVPASAPILVAENRPSTFLTAQAVRLTDCTLK